MKKYLNDYINSNHSFDKLTMLGVFALIAVITGIFGWVYEFIFYYFNGGMTDWFMRGGNFLPWINIYATGSILIYLFTYKYRKNPLKIFLSSVFITGIVEFIGGWVLYTFGNGFRCWDYNTEILNFGNIGGFVCLRSVLFFGLSSLILMYLIVPMIFNLAKKLNKKLFLTISFSVCFIFLFDEIYNLLIARLLSLPRASDIYKNIGFKYVQFK